MRLSIVIPYYNRRDKLLNVLRSIDFSYPLEVVLVDDGSDKEHQVFDIPSIYPDVRLIRLEKKGWRGAVTAYNTGFNEAKGYMIMINSSECMHIGNVVEYTFKNFKMDSYMAFGSLMGSRHINVNELLWDRPERFREQVAEIDNKYNLPADRTWWGVHSTVGNYLPYCAVISKSNMELLGGYDTRFLAGVGYDDNDFTHRVRNLGLNMICVDEPYVFHQWHKPTDYPNTKNLDLLKMLDEKYPKRIKANEFPSNRHKGR